jgi:hypothetical protein
MGADGTDGGYFFQRCYLLVIAVVVNAAPVIPKTPKLNFHFQALNEKRVVENLETSFQFPLLNVALSDLSSAWLESVLPPGSEERANIRDFPEIGLWEAEGDWHVKYPASANDLVLPVNIESLEDSKPAATDDNHPSYPKVSSSSLISLRFITFH